MGVCQCSPLRAFLGMAGMRPFSRSSLIACAVFFVPGQLPVLSESMRLNESYPSNPNIEQQLVLHPGGVRIMCDLDMAPEQANDAEYACSGARVEAVIPCVRGLTLTAASWTDSGPPTRLG